MKKLWLFSLSIASMSESQWTSNCTATWCQRTPNMWLFLNLFVPSMPNKHNINIGIHVIMTSLWLYMARDIVTKNSTIIIDNNELIAWGSNTWTRKRLCSKSDLVISSKDEEPLKTRTHTNNFICKSLCCFPDIAHCSQVRRSKHEWEITVNKLKEVLHLMSPYHNFDIDWLSFRSRRRCLS